MRFLPTNRYRLGPQRRPISGALGNDDGAAAIEFALVAMPFLLFVFGLIGYGLYFFNSTMLEYGAEVAARKVRTGEAEKGAMTVGEFKQLVCEGAGTIDCSKLSVLVQHSETWTGITPKACVDSKGNMAASTGSSGEMINQYAGTASEVVLVTLCYQWDLAKSFPFLNLGAGGSGAAIIQAATAFKSEPYK